MPVITIFGGIFCREEDVTRELCERTGYKLLGDADVLSAASRLSGMSVQKMGKVFSARTSVFNKFTHEKERSLAYLRLTLAQMLSEDRFVLQGFTGHLIPKAVSHALRVCLIADMASRISAAIQERALSESEAGKLIRKHDEDRAAWVLSLFQIKDPWEASLYDMVIPTDKKTLKETVDLITTNLGKEVIRPTRRSKKAVEGFLLAASVEVALAKEGHQVNVTADEGAVTLTISKHVLMLSRLEEELRSIAVQVPGVASVTTRVGPGFHKSDIYRKHDFELPSKVLLVDDEREFVQTLSERLLMRDMGSAVAYDGESALELIREDEPDVMILDLRMPGIDGIEVLKRVKKTQPGIEVIILTGHGSAADQEVCMRLGAFAYLQKPVDIDELSQTIRRAHQKINQRKAAEREV